MIARKIRPAKLTRLPRTQRYNLHAGAQGTGARLWMLHLVALDYVIDRKYEVCAGRITIRTQQGTCETYEFPATAHDFAGLCAYLSTPLSRTLRAPSGLYMSPADVTRLYATIDAAWQRYLLHQAGIVDGQQVY